MAVCPIINDSENRLKMSDIAETFLCIGFADACSFSNPLCKIRVIDRYRFIGVQEFSRSVINLVVDDPV